MLSQKANVYILHLLAVCVNGFLPKAAYPRLKTSDMRLKCRYAVVLF